MNSLRPLQTLADFKEAKNTARVVYNHSLAKMVPSKRAIRKSTNIGSLSAFATTKSNNISIQSKRDNKKQTSARRVHTCRCRSKSKGTVDEQRKTPNQMIQIFIQNPVRETLCLQLHPSTCISDIKDSLTDRLGIQTETQHLLTKKGFELCNSQSLRVLGIQPDTNLELCLVPGLMGGAGNEKTESAMNELSDSVQHLSLSSPVENTGKKRRKRKHRNKRKLNKERTIEKACDDGGQDAHISKDSSSAAGCMSEGHLQDADSTRCSETPFQDESRIVSACADINIEPGQLPNYATGAIPKKLTSVKKDSSTQKRTQVMDQRPQNDGAERRHDSVQSTRTSAEGKSHDEQKESKTMITRHKPPSHEEPAAHSIESEEGLKSNSDPAEFINTQGGQQMPAVGMTVTGSCNVVVIVESSPGASVNVKRPTGEWNMSTEADALDNKAKMASLAQTAADRCEAQLKERYRTTDSYVQTVPWVEEETRDIGEIYTNLDWTHKHEKGKETQDKLQSCGYSFLTKGELVPKRIILVGTAGLGKSTLLCKISYDWAMGVETLTKYKLVFHLKMHALDETSELIVAIFNQLLDHDSDIVQSDLQRFITDKSHRVLILLDGFNELMTSDLYDNNFGSILELLNRKIGRDCYVITTTRPSHMKELVHESLIQKPYTRIDVLGFASKDIEEYVVGFFHMQPDKAQKLLLRITSKDVLNDMAKRPMFLLLMCLLWEENNDLPETMASLYEAAMDNLFRRKSKKVESKNISDVLTKIGDIALKGLLHPKLMSSFKETDFESSVLKAAMKAGILTSKEVITGARGHTRIEFMHRTIHEYCAALYLQSLKSDSCEFQQTLQQIEGLTKDNPNTFEYLFRFCCVNAECMNAVLKMLKDYQDPRLALECYFESQSDELPPADFINSVISESITIGCWNSDCINSLMHFLKQVSDQKKVQDNIYLKKVQTLQMIKCNLFNFSRKLERCIDKMTSITGLHLTECSLTSDTMKPIAKSLAKSNLVELDLSWNEGLRDSVHLWVSSLQHVKKLVLKSCSLTGNDIKDIADSQKEKPTIVELDLSGNKHAFAYVEESVLRFCNELVNLSCLERLILGSCSITGQSFKSVATALGKIPTLTELILIGNELCGSAELWSLCLKEMKRLEIMDFRCCSLEAEDVLRILSSGMVSLLCLKLSGNRSLGGNTNACNWCSQIHSLSCIEELELKDCNLDRSDFTCLVSLIGSLRTHRPTNCPFDLNDVQRFLVIARLSTGGVRLDLSGCCLSEKMLIDVLEAISNKHDIVQLALCMNEGLGGYAIGWSRYIADLMRLEEVDLRHCKVSSTDIEALATSLSVISTLVELNLSENDALGGCAAEWASHLARLQHMKRLHLSKCSLRSRDVKDMATSFCDARSLVELDLSINGLLRDTGKLWDYLKHMKQLQNLDLSLCSLISEDANNISKTLSYMPTLIRLNLSDNYTLKSTPLASLFTQFHSDSDNVFVRDIHDE